MAGAMVGGAFLSASLQVLFDRIACPEVVDFIKGRKLDHDLLKKLEITLLSVNAVLDDAEENQIKNRYVRKWLDELKDVVYDAEDLLDEISTEAFRCEIEAESQTTVTQVKNFFSSYNPFRKEINSKLEEVLARLEFIAKQKDVLGLREGFAERPSRKFEETSIVDESSVYGRDDEKESLVELLLSDDSGGADIGIVTIAGMGGLGKTTLAQFLYNDYRVKQWFNSKAWVCVSDEFDIFRLTKSILEQVTSSTTGSDDLNTLQTKLMGSLSGKKFLVILDDVWNEDYFVWERLRTPFNAGLRGSKIIVTTRNQSVASVVCTTHLHNLNVLEDSDCWLLFARHAFANANSRAQYVTETTQREILKRCKGLPLAAKALGSLLRIKSSPMEWDEILKSEIWEYSDSIMPVLRISYLHLPSELKRCFAYCAVFPKDYEFNKKEVIELWIAENFLHQHFQRREEVGEQYFDILVSRSLFQPLGHGKLSYVMHDLVHDLAKFESGEFCFWLEGDNPHGITKKARHISYSQIGYDTFNKFEGMCVARHLRTFLPIRSNPSRKNFFFLSKSVLHNLLPTLKCLRVLSLSHYGYITELPDSIGNLKHLRLLDISCTAIKWLPNSTCTLYNLMMLKLLYCPNMTELPTEMHKLRKLSHLDLTGTNIRKMPVQMSKLKCLETLTLYSVGRASGMSIKELRQLNNLRGKLSILELQNINSPVDALDAALKDKKHLDRFCLEWNTDSGDSQKERDILQKLQPNAGLKELAIKNYGGTAFPSWLVNQAFSHIAVLCLSNCKYCFSLPPLGQLHSLRDLSIIGFHVLVTVDLEFYGSVGSAVKPFESLITLRFEEMLEWEEWFPFKETNEGGAFPCLQELHVENCPKLTKHLPSKLPDLRKLVVSECPQLVDSLPKAPHLHHLQLGYCDKSMLKDLPPKLNEMSLHGWSLSDRLEEAGMHLKILKIYDCLSLSWIPMDHLCFTLTALEIKSSGDLNFPVHLYYASLEKLSIENSCHSLRNFPLDIFPNLKDLALEKCTSLESLFVPSRPQYDLMCLRRLVIVGCPNFRLFPEGGLRAPNLLLFRIVDCERLNSLPQNMHACLPSLQIFTIAGCPQLASFPETGLPSNLEALWICGCSGLFANQAQWHLQRLASLREISINASSIHINSLLDSGLLPTTLTSLRLIECPNMESFNGKGLHELRNLQYLFIYDCLRLKCLPEEGLPKHLSTFFLLNCPLLKERCQGKRGEDWSKISHIPCIWIDNEIFP